VVEVVVLDELLVEDVVEDVVVVVDVEDIVVVVDVTTVICRFGVYSPNHSTPSCTIGHWKLYMPAVEGAVTLNWKVLLCPGAIDSPDDR
jgi:hypothetical protein